jgi:hypothetical protein
MPMADRMVILLDIDKLIGSDLVTERTETTEPLPVATAA